MDNLEKKLLNELKRFNQIGYNSQNLSEQNLGGFGNLGMGSHVERILGKTELGEQEDVEADVETEDDEDTTSFDELGLGDAEVEMETGDAPTDENIPAAPPTPPAAPTTLPTTPPPAIPGAPEKEDENTTEVEVTDLVSNQETLEKNTSETNDKLESLMSMLDGMEEKLTGMDELMNQISSLEQKIEKYRPKSEEEIKMTKELEKQDKETAREELKNLIKVK